VGDAEEIRELWLEMPECYDFFGRIAIYTFGLWGVLLADAQHPSPSSSSSSCASASSSASSATPEDEELGIVFF
jgi:hypothetical protein